MSIRRYQPSNYFNLRTLCLSVILGAPLTHASSDSIIQNRFMTQYQYLLTLPFEPPKAADIPKGKAGESIRKGLDIFTNTLKYKKYLQSNQLTCSNCHLDAGRKANSAPMWGAYPLFPHYRKKNNKINSIDLRIRECIQYSLNGKPPEADSDFIIALESYFAWLSTGAPLGIPLPGKGYPLIAKPKEKPNHERGLSTYKEKCSMCHGKNGEGLIAAGKVVYPPLWGKQSYNWGAGMHQIDKAAAFIEENMPFKSPVKLTTQEAWDVAYFINGQPRPADPRTVKAKQKTNAIYHQHDCRYELQTVN